MSVFRSPYERLYHRLGAILDREEILLRGRTDSAALTHADSVTNARVRWLAKGREIEPIVRARERWIWVAVALSCAFLLVCSLWPGLEVKRWVACLCLGVVVCPLLWGAWRITADVNNKLAQVRADIERL